MSVYADCWEAHMSRMTCVKLHTQFYMDFHLDHGTPLLSTSLPIQVLFAWVSSCYSFGIVTNSLIMGLELVSPKIASLLLTTCLGTPTQLLQIVINSYIYLHSGSVSFTYAEPLLFS